MSEMQRDASTAREIATEAGRVLLQLRAAADDSLRRGEPFDDAALRSAGDAAAQSAIAAALAKAFPRDSVLSEEAADNLERLDADRVWIVDPLDGTREFGERTPDGGWRDDFAVHVALWVRGRGLTLGAVALPGRGEIFGSDAPPALPTSTRRKLRLAVSRTRPPQFVAAAESSGVATLVPMGSAGFKVMAVVTGEVDAYIHAGGQYQWDSAAPVAVALAAGLVATRLNGSPLRYNVQELLLPDLMVCHPDRAEEVRALLDAAGFGPNVASNEDPSGSDATGAGASESAR
jgi:3'(2'), 5'-bisphosphate nucleotidase